MLDHLMLSHKSMLCFCFKYLCASSWTVSIAVTSSWCLIYFNLIQYVFLYPVLYLSALKVPLESFLASSVFFSLLILFSLLVEYVESIYNSSQHCFYPLLSLCNWKDPSSLLFPTCMLCSTPCTPQGPSAGTFIPSLIPIAPPLWAPYLSPNLLSNLCSCEFTAFSFSWQVFHLLSFGVDGTPLEGN